MGTRDGGIRAPDPGKVVDQLHTQVGDIVRRTTPLTPFGRTPFHITCHFQGLLADSVASDPCPVPNTGRLRVVRFKPSTPGLSDTTLTVSKNGTPLTPLGAGSTTITLPGSGAAEVSVQFDSDDHLFMRIGGVPADEYTVELITAGTGASGLISVATFG